MTTFYWTGEDEGRQAAVVTQNHLFIIHQPSFNSYDEAIRSCMFLLPGSLVGRGGFASSLHFTGRAGRGALSSGSD